MSDIYLEKNATLTSLVAGASIHGVSAGVHVWPRDATHRFCLYFCLLLMAQSFFVMGPVVPSKAPQQSENRFEVAKRRISSLTRMREQSLVILLRVLCTANRKTSFPVPVPPRNWSRRILEGLGSLAILQAERIKCSCSG